VACSEAPLPVVCLALLPGQRAVPTQVVWFFGHPSDKVKLICRAHKVCVIFSSSAWDKEVHPWPLGKVIKVVLTTLVSSMTGGGLKGGECFGGGDDGAFTRVNFQYILAVFSIGFFLSSFAVLVPYCATRPTLFPQDNAFAVPPLLGLMPS
jgi:hypothetical protein